MKPLSSKHHLMFTVNVSLKSLMYNFAHPINGMASLDATILSSWICLMYIHSCALTPVSQSFCKAAKTFLNGIGEAAFHDKMQFKQIERK